MKGTWISAAAVLLVAFAFRAPARADTLTFDSINTSAAPFYTDASTTAYLAEYGITLINNTANTSVYVVCANGQFNSSCTSGFGAEIAESGPNVLEQINTPTGPPVDVESYTLEFSTPLSNLTFYTAGWNGTGPSGLLVAAWNATAYDGNTAVSSVGQGIGSYYSIISPEEWTLAGPDITSVTFESDCYGVCAENLAIDNLSAPELTETPEPPTLWLMVAGMLVAALYGMRKSGLGARP